MGSVSTAAFLGGSQVLGQNEAQKWNQASFLQGWTQPSRVGWVDVPTRRNMGGLSLAACAGLMFQPDRTKGWLLVTVLSEL